MLPITDSKQSIYLCEQSIGISVLVLANETLGTVEVAWTNFGACMIKTSCYTCYGSLVADDVSSRACYEVERGCVIAYGYVYSATPTQTLSK